jgi:hypothetical protein
MTFYKYLLDNLENTARIDLHIEDNIFQYNYWNWILRDSTHYQKSELHLLNDDYTIGHILYDGKVSENEDGSVVYYSKNYPCKLILNFSTLRRLNNV